MVRMLFLLLAVLLPVGLVYAFGPWVLLALFGVAARRSLFSTRKARGAEATQGGRLTGYHTTTMADFWPPAKRGEELTASELDGQNAATSGRLVPTRQ